MRIAALAFIMTLASANLYAQECTLSPRTAMTGDTLTVSVPGLNSPLGTLTLKGGNA